jgi:hypothetical protein
VLADTQVGGGTISLFEAAYLTAACPYVPLLAAVFAPIHVASAAAYLTGVLGKFATEKRLRAYGFYEAVELAVLLYPPTLRLPS